MPTLVHFGAGNIGRGFVAPLFTIAGWRVVFVDIDEPRISALHEQGRYQIIEVTNDDRVPVEVGPVDGILAGDTEAVVAALADCDLVSTAVGMGALKFLGANLAAGLAARGDQPMDILICENGIEAPDLLRQAFIDAGATELDHVGFVRTSIGRMIPPPAGDADLLDIVVEPYAKLPLEASAFKGPPPSDVPAVKLAYDFDLVLREKLYLHNLSHACAAYRGHRLGYADLPACMADAGLEAGVKLATTEAIKALAKAHSKGDPDKEAAIRADGQAMLADLCVRYRNTALGDPVARVARDPIRKLGPKDRLIGAARLCLTQGIQPLALAHHILDACAYNPADDEPNAAHFRSLQQQGWQALLADVANLQPEEPLMATLDIAARQQEAAELIDQAGIYLRPDEISQIEIADFGLKRYDELGLAIHVYCNTDRCCAKELAMVPGQICPEHRHPHVDDQPGKEETFRVRSGEVHLFVPGDRQDDDAKKFALSLVPADKHDTVTVFGHIHLQPGEQYTLAPNTPHWFVAGKDGAVVSEFSTKSRDDADVFTDAEIQRVPEEGPHNG